MQLPKAVLLIGVFMAGMVVGVPLGARIGLWEFALADAQHKAARLSYDLAAIKAGRTENLISGMEISLNSELSLHGQYMESRLWWLWPELQSDDDSHIRTAVAYRLANPYEGPDLAKPENWKPGLDMDGRFVREVVEGQRIQREYMHKVLQHYGDMSHGDKRLSP